MKRLMIAAIAAVLFHVSAFAQDKPRTIEMKVDGLVCAFCAQGISKKLGSLEGTNEVLVNLEKGVVAIALKPGHEISDDLLRSALTDAGYAVRSIEHKDETLDQLRERLKVLP